MRAELEADPRRKHPHMLLWLKTKIEVIDILFRQKRFEDCEDSIEITKQECEAIKDQVFRRQLNEVEFMMMVQYGDRDKALVKGRSIREHAKKFSQ